MYVEDTMKQLQKQICGDDYVNDEYYQAVEEVFNNIKPLLDKMETYEQHKILERLIIPNEMHKFKVTWQNDKGETEVNIGYRIQYNNTLGVYKGGTRFHPSVNEKILKFLAFEQTFKNALSGLPIGGGKGGADFNPKGKSDSEIMRFCYAYAEKLNKYIGADIDVPAGDMGVGSKELGYMFTQLTKIRGSVDFGILSGKPLDMNGSLLRKEATGYGLVYMLLEMVNKQDNLNITKTENYINNMKDLKPFLDKRVVVSGSGNVAIYAAEKVQQLGGIVIAMSDSSGTIIDEQGINLRLIKKIKEENKDRIKVYKDEVSHSQYIPKEDYDSGTHAIWNIQNTDYALPCGTQNELWLEDAKNLKKNGCTIVAEGANMPLSPDAIDQMLKSDIYFAPGKLANLGGVATSYLEMSQNASLDSWSITKVENRLIKIMDGAFTNACKTAKEFGDDETNLLMGANIFGFKRVADAMVQGGFNN